MENYDLDNFEPAAKIVVIGVGGAGNNAVNRMIDEEIQNVEFFVANTDKQALSTSKATNRIILGESITGGLGAGGEPEIGEKAAEASADTIREIVKDANGDKIEVVDWAENNVDVYSILKQKIEKGQTANSQNYILNHGFHIIMI